MSGFWPIASASPWTSRSPPIRTPCASRVRAFLADRSPSAYVRAMVDDERGFDRRALDQVVELGWTGLLVPEAHGGLGLGLVDAVVVLEEMGRVPFPGPFFSSAVCATHRGAARSASTDLLARLAAGATARHGRARGARATATRSTGSAPGPGARAADWVLTGLKPIVLDGHTADWVIVAARTQEGIGSFLLEAPDAEPVPTMDPTRKVARLVLDEHAGRRRSARSATTPRSGARIADDTAVGARGRARRRVRRARSRWRSSTPKVRVQFDQPIASHQVIQHKIVDMLPPARARPGRRALRGVGLRRRRRAPRRARPRSPRLRWARPRSSSPRENIQVHGAVGFTWDCDAQLPLQAGEAERHAARLPGLAAPARRRPRPRRADADRPTRPTGHDACADAVARARARGRRAAPRRRAHPLERRGPRGRAAVVGPGPALHARDAQPVEPRRAVLPGRARRPGRHRATRATRSRTSRRTRGSSAAYQSGAVEVEHWSFLAFAQRLEAAARGLPAVVDPLDRRLVDGGERRRTRRSTRRSAPVGLLAPLAPDVAILHAPVADRAGNVAIAPPLLEGRLGRARRPAAARSSPSSGSSTTSRESSDLVRIPAHRVLAVCEAPMGAHPGGLFTGGAPGRRLRRGLRLLGRGARRDPSRRLRRLDPPLGPRARRPRTEYLDRLGADRVARAAGQGRSRLVAASTPRRTRPTSTRRSNAWERAATFGARHLADRVARARRGRGARGCRRRQPRGVARRASSRGAQGSDVQLTAEIGLWGYEPTLGDPFVLNHRNFPSADDARRRGDGARQTLVGGPGTTTIGCLGGAQVDRHGNINSTLDPRRPVPRRLGRRQRRRERRGRGRGRRDAHAAADAARVRLRHVTRPRGARARHRSRPAREARRDGELVLVAVPAGPGAARRADRARPRRVRMAARGRGRGRGAAGADRGRDRGAAGLGPPRLVPPRPDPCRSTAPVYAHALMAAGRAGARHEAVRRRHRGRRPHARGRATASSSCCSARPAAASRPRCA